MTAVNRFYTWQVSAKNLPNNPIPQRARRSLPPTAGRRGHSDAATAPATYSHGAAREKIEWLPPATYRRWRDVGMRGYTPRGLPDSGFRGRWAARNALFSDVMVRTGLRLAEQTALTVFDMPLDRGLGGYQRFWLPAAIVKGGSARRVYVPQSLVGEAIAYAQMDRIDAVEQARAAGRYRRWRHPFVVEDPDRPIARRPDGGRMKVAQLDPNERLRLLIDGPHGLEPAVFWLTEAGTPMTKSAWKQLFRTANLRCHRHGIRFWVHAHMLRHTFATELASAGVSVYALMRLLGHESMVTSQRYVTAAGAETRAAAAQNRLCGLLKKPE